MSLRADSSSAPFPCRLPGPHKTPMGLDSVRAFVCGVPPTRVWRCTLAHVRACERACLSAGCALAGRAYVSVRCSQDLDATLSRIMSLVDEYQQMMATVSTTSSQVPRCAKVHGASNTCPSTRPTPCRRPGILRDRTSSEGDGVCVSNTAAV
jgi:hypothetical protein